MTQKQQVIEAMRNNGGYATLRQLNETIDFSSWGTKTPEASVRQIVQINKEMFKVQPGLWALEEFRDAVLAKFNLKPDNKNSVEKFTHGYYQGLLVEIGKMEKHYTYIPAQDKNRIFLSESLKNITDTTILPKFTYEKLCKRAKTVDVIWFNKEREMPTDLFEVEHSTDMKNSLSKFYELQDFFASFNIVADKSRENEFKDKLNASIFDAISKRVNFISYDKVAKRYEGLKIVNTSGW